MHRVSRLTFVPLLLLTACSGETPPPAPETVTITDDQLAIFRVPAGEPIEDADKNPPAERVALGKKLYHDKRMSPDSSVSCATCHDLATFGVDNKPTSTGFKGQKGDRNAPTSLNAFKQMGQFWDWRMKTVEEQATGPILNPIEHGFTKEADVVAILKKDAALVGEFKPAFPGDPDPVTLKNVGRAIGAFERTLVTTSRFDKFLDGEKKALTSAEKQGLIDFVETGCTTCHFSRQVGGQMPNKLGLLHPWKTEDTGRHRVTKEDSDQYFFKVPSLLNVAKTGPYLHDGSIESLDEIVEKMAWHQVGKKLTAEKVKSIVTFLHALTGELPQ